MPYRERLICPVCQEPFIPKRKGKGQRTETCSPHCSAVLRWRRHGDRLREFKRAARMPKVTRVCPVCCTTFELQYPGSKTKTCSPRCGTLHASGDPLDRFWNSVDSSAGPDGCWHWTGRRSHDGTYGTFWLGGRNHMAHREMWKLVNGAIPRGMLVLHACEDRGCVNPAHLYLGDYFDLSMVQRGRKKAGIQ